jgi:transposase InsO family protein
MPWMECSQMTSRLEFVQLAQSADANISALCIAFGISRKTGYKWLQRHAEGGVDALADRSRRPSISPSRSNSDIEATIVALYLAYPCWGGRKLKALLPNDFPEIHPTTIDAILARNGCELVPSRQPGKLALARFEHEAPNMLWQMDFKGHFALTDAAARRCHPLTVLDDHSRFNICLTACSTESGAQVQAALINAFRKYGLPQRITCDNGPPWGTAGRGTVSALGAWIIRLGVRIGHSRPYHPQTQGKDERFHRTLKLELLERYGFNSIELCQAGFDRWRDEYNLIRPHQALGQLPPVTRYSASGRPFPEALPPIEYEPEDQVRMVRKSGKIKYDGGEHFIGEGLTGQPVAVRHTTTDGVVEVFYCAQKVRTLDMREIA